MVDWSRRAHISDSILEAVGQTPLVRLRRLTAPGGAEILVKLEYLSPSGSVKDRIVPFIVAEAERRGQLRPGMVLIEGTTGNTGIATAMVGAVRGYRAIIVMPRGMSRERRLAIQAYGAELVLTPGGASDGALVVARVEELKAELGGRAFEVGQFTNPDNPRIHELTTGPELWEQAGGRLDAFVAAQGTGGTITGVARYLRGRVGGGRVAVYAAEPAECPILSEQRCGPHKIEGVSDGLLSDVIDLGQLNGVVRVTSDEAIATARRLAREEGIFCGISSGCNVSACLKLAAARPELRRIVTLASDHGFRYLSTELCGGAPGGAAEEPAHELQVAPEQRRLLQAVEVIG